MSSHADDEKLPPKKNATNKSAKTTSGTSRLRWITTSHPDQIRDRDVMRSIRGHALKSSGYHQNRVHHLKRKRLAQETVQPVVEAQVGGTVDALASSDDPSVAATRSSTPCSAAHVNAFRSYGPDQQPTSSTQKQYPASLQSLYHSNEVQYEASPQPFSVPQIADLNHSAPTSIPVSVARRLSIESLLNPLISTENFAIERLPDLVDSTSSSDEENHNLWDVMMVRQPGSSIDPFRSLPQFRNPRISVEKLQHYCSLLRNHTWGAHHQRLVISDPLVFLASLSAGAAYQETLCGIPGESLVSAAIKAELIAMINERLRDPILQTSDETIAAVSHMVNFEVFHNEQRLITHVRGLEQLVFETTRVEGDTEEQEMKRKELLSRGLRIQSRAMGAFVVYELSPSFKESWSSYIPAPFVAASSTYIPLESPYHGIRVANSELQQHCSPNTYALLLDMQTLTRMLLDQNAVDQASAIICHDNMGHLTQPQVAGSILTDLLALPSANIPDTPVSGDWMYECCRLLGLIYATAIIRKTPFSRAVQHAAAASGTPNILQDLCATLRRTDLNNIWPGMTGVLFWVATTACPAVHLPPGTIYTPDLDLAKKWFIMVAIRVNSITGQQYGHGAANDAAMRLVLKIQAILAGTS